MANNKKPKKLNEKQQMALALMTSGLGMKYKDIAEAVGVSQRQLYDWRYSSDFLHFQEELKRLNDLRWQATIDAAREGALKLCADGNQKMIEFVLKNEGYNPTNKVEAEVSSNIIITIGDDDE